MSNHNCNLIIKQHKNIQSKISDIQAKLESVKKDPSTLDQPQLEQELKQLVMLMDAHSLCEEQILLPILKEMYKAQPEILKYVIEDHVVFQNELSQLMDSDFDILKNMRKIKSLLNRILVHFVEEENGLIPLVDQYLSSTTMSPKSM